MNPVFYIAIRYALSKSKTKAIHIITLISSLGIVISSMVMFIVLSVFNGLEDYSLSFVNQIDADLTIYPKNGKYFSLNKKQEKSLQNIKEISAFSKVIEQPVIFIFNEKQKIATLKAVDSTYLKIASISNHLLAGSWFDKHINQVVFGYLMAQTLGTGLYSNDGILEIMAMKSGRGMVANPQDLYTKFPIAISGIYSFNNSETDAKYAYAPIELARNLLNLNDSTFSQIEIKLTSFTFEEDVIFKINQIFNSKVEIKNKLQLNSSLYKMLQTEKISIFFIFTLVVFVTLFCLAGALIMMILEKKKHFKTLFHLGFTTSQLKRIVLYQGLLITVSSSLIGILLGFTISYLQFVYGFIRISEDLPYPISIKIINVFQVLVILLVLGFVASKLASYQVTKDSSNNF